MKKALVLWAALVILLTAEFCKPGSSPLSPTGGSEITANGLKMTVSTTGQGTGGLTFLIELKNEGTSTASLEFSTGQAFDIAVSNSGGDVVWTWSYDKAFTQAFWELDLKPGESYSMQAAWDLKANDGSQVQPGRYGVKAWMTNFYRNKFWHNPNLSVEFLLVI